ncbi:MAG TPA: VTT domain-containing protein [Anaerolineaceae bacterium]
MQSPWPGRILRLVLILGIIGLSVLLYLHRGQIKQLEGYGYPGIFLFNLLSSATIILPVPGVALTSLMGAIFNPFWVAVAAGSGAALGELSGYLAGVSGQNVAERTPIYTRIEGWMTHYGELVILVLAIIPNPFFDIAGMMAGALKMPVWKFLMFCWLGKIVKMLMFAYGGATIMQFFPAPQ